MGPLTRREQARALPAPLKTANQYPILPYLAIAMAIMAFPPGIFAGEKEKPGKSRPNTVSLPPSPYRIVIDKSDYELRVYDPDGWLVTYPVVFGNKDQSDKTMEGDRRTPDGVFHVIAKKNREEWGGFMLLDYPNAESLQRFHDRKREGMIPANATVGGGIGIHGTRPHEEYAVDKYLNWTDGCISLKYTDVLELYRMIPVGTEVVIQP